MLGTLFNVATILLGSLLGLFIRNSLPERFVKIVFQSLGLFTLFLGFSMCLKTDNQFMLLVFSLIIGSILGEMLRLEARFEQMSDWLKHKIKSKNEKFTEGLLTSFILFCIGPMAILGSIQEGLGESSDLLYTKSVMDGFSSIALSSAMGIGVLFSIIPLFFFQGGITVLASYISNFLNEAMINELTAVGGILLLGLALNILELKKIKVLNMLPSLVVVIVLYLVFERLGLL